SLIRAERDSAKQKRAYNARSLRPLRDSTPPPASATINLHQAQRQILSGDHWASAFWASVRAGPPDSHLVATLAVQQNSRVVHFESASRMLDFFHMSKDGRHYRRVVQGFQRIFASTIFFGTEENSWQ